MSSPIPIARGRALREAARPISGDLRDYSPLMKLIGDARFVLLGEATHGTHEFYRERARITMKLVEEKGFTAVAIEGDWPDAYRVNRYVRGARDDIDAMCALRGFKRFPTWMWRNMDIVKFVERLRAHNEALPRGAVKAGFYGLDLYSLHASMEAVLRFLDEVDPAAARKARARYACFDHYGENAQIYGFVTASGASKSCEEEVIKQLVEVQTRAAELAAGRGGTDHDKREEAFHAEQNARLVKNAEAYYRSMFVGEALSWNVRDRHMLEALEALEAHLIKQVGRAKIVIWAHNSHIGDSRATEMARRGELNLGQLVRDRYPGESALVGFTTHTGTVTAASDWDAPAERKQVRPALPGSYEALLHEVGIPRFLVVLRGNDALAADLDEPLLERAIGVIYRPDTERMSHYFHSRIVDQFDAVIHIDQTQAVEPLERTGIWDQGELPETFPFAV